MADFNSVFEPPPREIKVFYGSCGCLEEKKRKWKWKENELLHSSSIFHLLLLLPRMILCQLPFKSPCQSLPEVKKTSQSKWQPRQGFLNLFNSSLKELCDDGAMWNQLKQQIWISVEALQGFAGIFIVVAIIIRISCRDLRGFLELNGLFLKDDSVNIMASKAPAGLSDWSLSVSFFLLFLLFFFLFLGHRPAFLSSSRATSSASGRTLSSSGFTMKWPPSIRIALCHRCPQSRLWRFQITQRRSFVPRSRCTWTRWVPTPSCTRILISRSSLRERLWVLSFFSFSSVDFWCLVFTSSSLFQIVYVKKTQSLAETGKEKLLEMLRKGSEGDSYFEDKRAFVNMHFGNMKNSSKAVAKIHKAGTSQFFFLQSCSSFCSAWEILYSFFCYPDLVQTTKEASTRYGLLAEATTEDSLAGCDSFFFFLLIGFPEESFLLTFLLSFLWPSQWVQEGCLLLGELSWLPWKPS